MHLQQMLHIQNPAHAAYCIQPKKHTQHMEHVQYMLHAQYAVYAAYACVCCNRFLLHMQLHIVLQVLCVLHI